MHKRQLKKCECACIDWVIMFGYGFIQSLGLTDQKDPKKIQKKNFRP